MRRHPPFSLMVHGGAGAFERLSEAKEAERYLDSVRAVLEAGRALLERGGSALDAVEHCAALLEDDPLFNAGRGSVLDENAQVRMDAAIMDGRDLTAGAVAGVGNIANPIRLARLVKERSGHVLLIGEGAMHFAAQCGVGPVPDSYFITPERVVQLEAARKHGSNGRDPAGPLGDPDGRGTIGAVARDRDGNLAAATSTGGIVNKRAGRVGDSAVIGAGVYADNESCAVSTTGVGEDFLRTALAKTIADALPHAGGDAAAAVTQGMTWFRRRIQGRGGVIVIDRSGRCAADFTTPHMIHGWIERGGESVCRC